MVVSLLIRNLHGEYLAGDIGSTIEMSRSYENGMKFEYLFHLQMYLPSNLVKGRLIKVFFLIFQFMVIS